MVPIGLGLLAIGAFDRSTLVLATGAAILAVALGLMVVSPAHADTWVAAGLGAVFVAAGLVARASGSDSAP